MKSELFEFIGKKRPRRNETFRVQLSVFFVCLALSVFIWSLVRLSKDFYHSLEYKLNYVQVPSSLKLVSASDSLLTLKIKLQGFDYFSERFFISHEQQFDVSLKNVRLIGSGEQLKGYLLAARIGREIVSQSNFPNDLFYVSPDTLFFQFQRQKIQKMPSKAATQIELLERQADSAGFDRDSLNGELIDNP